MIETETDILAHYGVKGMKWGVRKEHYRSYSDKGSRTERRISATRYQAKINMGRYYVTGAKLKSVLNLTMSGITAFQLVKNMYEKVQH